MIIEKEKRIFLMELCVDCISSCINRMPNDTIEEMQTRLYHKIMNFNRRRYIVDYMIINK